MSEGSTDTLSKKEYYLILWSNLSEVEMASIINCESVEDQSSSDSLRISSCIL